MATKCKCKHEKDAGDHGAVSHGHGNEQDATKYFFKLPNMAACDKFVKANPLLKSHKMLPTTNGVVKQKSVNERLAERRRQGRARRGAVGKKSPGSEGGENGKDAKTQKTAARIKLTTDPRVRQPYACNLCGFMTYTKRDDQGESVRLWFAKGFEECKRVRPEPEVGAVEAEQPETDQDEPRRSARLVVAEETKRRRLNPLQDAV